MPQQPSVGEMRYGVLLLTRTLANADGFGEEVESWPELGAVRYPAAIEELTGTEQLATALRQSNTTMRVTVRKQCPVTALDRLKREDTGDILRIGGVFSDLEFWYLACEIVRG
jgi:head-tail adaptor